MMVPGPKSHRRYKDWRSIFPYLGSWTLKGIETSAERAQATRASGFAWGAQVAIGDERIGLLRR